VKARFGTSASFARNAWYVAAWADELAPGALLGRKLLDEPVLLYRTAGGEVAAIENRCCHRSLPLEHGAVIGDNVRCGYHGLLYDKTGAVIKVPGQDRVPPEAKVKSYPVAEQDRLVWIWMGAAKFAERAAIVRHPWHDDPKWGWTKDRYVVGANYQLITDNLMDLTHVGYVHTKTIGGTPEAHSSAETRTARTASGVRVERWMLNSIPPPSYTAAVKFGKERVDRWMEIDFFPASVVRIHTGAVDAGTGAKEGRRDGGFGFMGLNAMTPETEHSTHYFWSGAHNFNPGVPAATARMRASLEVTFGEDKMIVESQYAAMRANPAAPQVAIASDAGMVQARRLVEDMIKKEEEQTREHA
jgi:phenylpropionate dioxygenase-like ring-hydroxylating dioxygenase large terminal subunit